MKTFKIDAIKTLCLLANIRSETTDRKPFFKDELRLLGLECGGKRKLEAFDLFKN